MHLEEDMQTIRVFIAVELPPDLRDALGRAQRTLQAVDAGAARSVKWADPASVHLTLKFLGETPAAKLEAIGAAMQQAVAGRHALVLSLGAPGCFPTSRQPRVLWIGVTGEVDALSQLQAAVEATVSPLGFPTETRRFSPHLTLGRVRDGAAPDAAARLGAAIRSLKPIAVSFVVTGISLMRSDLQPAGAVYTRLMEAALT